MKFTISLHPNRLQIKPTRRKVSCLEIYSIVTDHYRPSPSRLRDWISSPKSTGYEALHITVMAQRDDGLKSKSGVNVWMKLRRKAMQRITNIKWNSRRRLRQLVKFTKRSPRKFRNQRGRFCRRFQNEFVPKEIYVLHLKETSSLYQKEQPH
jgi:(p)ppGpp synthase/HD superfamily hydrolase